MSEHESCEREYRKDFEIIEGLCESLRQAREKLAEAEKKIKDLKYPNYWGQSKRDIKADFYKQKSRAEKAEAELASETAKRERAEAERDEALKPHEAFLAGYKKNWEDAMEAHRKLFQKNSSLSVVLDKALKEREELEDRIGDIAVAIGLDESERQWSNLNDPIQNIIERAEAAESRAQAQSALLERVQATVNTAANLLGPHRPMAPQDLTVSQKYEFILETARELLTDLLAQLPVTPAPVEEKKP